MHEIAPSAGQWHARARAREREDIGGANTPFVLVAPPRDGSFRFMPARCLRDRELNLSYGTCNFGLLLETGFTFVPAGLPYSSQGCARAAESVFSPARRRKTRTFCRSVDRPAKPRHWLVNSEAINSRTRAPTSCNFSCDAVYKVPHPPTHSPFSLRFFFNATLCPQFMDNIRQKSAKVDSWAFEWWITENRISWELLV